MTNSPVAASNKLRPVLGLFSAAAIVVGGTIGSGVFLKPTEIARAFIDASASPESANAYVPLILALWIGCGVVNLCGALALAELATMLPHSGGNYVYLREAYGRMWAFLWGWAEFWVIRSGSNAALAAGMTILLVDRQNGLLSQLGYILPESISGPFELGFPILIIVGLTAINIIGASWGGFVQNVTTVIKCTFVVFLAILPFLVRDASIPDPGTPLVSGTSSLMTALGISLGGIMWAYDGWGMVTGVAEEIKDPQRNIPKALTGGVIVLILLYLGANLAYHNSMAMQVLARVENPAVALVGRLMGPDRDYSRKIMQGLLMISIFGALNSNILVGPRVLFATARDNPYLGWLRRVDPRFGTPALAIAGLSLWSCVLVVVGFFTKDIDFSWPGATATAIAQAAQSSLPVDGASDASMDQRTASDAAKPLQAKEKRRLFDVLTAYTVFGGSLFYFAAVAAVFVLRKKRPDLPRPYRTWGYPHVPLIFVLFYVFLLWSMLWSSPRECLSGLSLIGLGMAAYLTLWKAWGKPTL